MELIHRFKTKNLPDIPPVFPYPFHYIPDELAKIAVSEMQSFHLQELEKYHDFGLTNSQSGLGKMIGVLVVRDSQDSLGYLMAFSGKLDCGNHVKGWVPPVFDTLCQHNFYLKGEKEITKINEDIQAILSSESFTTLSRELDLVIQESERDIAELKQLQKRKKEERNQIRQQIPLQNDKNLIEILNNQSIHDHYIYKDRKKEWNKRIKAIQNELFPMQNTLESLKVKRKEKSTALQRKLFEAYSFLNREGKTKNLIEIFEKGRGIVPPSGSGECTAPKLLQYAYLHNLHPVTMAEFWWGKPPESEVRKHGMYYPACTGKCKPILSHMLQDIEVAKNPLKVSLDNITLDIVWEDEDILIINKPANFLTVPGKDTRDSILSILEKKYPHASGPLIVHRLDMSTSGLLLVAKSKLVHQHLQNQFSKRKIKKTYTAILDGYLPSGTKGTIDLPLRVNIDNRPKQMVCFAHGKPAKTHYEVMDNCGQTSRVLLFPITGRTHQLRVHCADNRGLGISIKGDDLYGTVSDRLYLHATEITFIHPIKGKEMHIISTCPF